jgi:hypothetical protein
VDAREKSSLAALGTASSFSCVAREEFSVYVDFSLESDTASGGGCCSTFSPIVLIAKSRSLWGGSEARSSNSLSEVHFYIFSEHPTSSRTRRELSASSVQSVAKSTSDSSPLFPFSQFFFLPSHTLVM